jgi:DNA uptake protein ComE-like DNA-binding protein
MNMEFESLLLVVVIWLLWTIHQDLAESNDRQRALKTALNQLASRVEQLLGTRDALAGSAASAAATVNINSASKAKLQTLPRIGAVTAEHIIASRPYNTVEELREVQGVTNAIFSEIQDRVSI